MRLLTMILTLIFALPLLEAMAAKETLSFPKAEVFFDRSQQSLEIKEKGQAPEKFRMDDLRQYDFIHSVKRTEEKEKQFLELVVFSVCDGTKERRTEIKWIVFEWVGTELVRRNTQSLGTDAVLCQQNEAWEKPVPLDYALPTTKVLITADGNTYYTFSHLIGR